MLVYRPDDPARFNGTVVLTWNNVTAGYDLFGAESLEDLKKQIGGRLEAEYAGAARAIMKRALLDQLDDQVKFELPES